MKLKPKHIFPLILFLTLTSFGAHKFYVSIYQINYAPEKRMLQITSRIFTDDLNDALFRKFHVKTNLGEKNESAEDIALMKKYIIQNFSIKINGESKAINYLSREFENNVTICYFNVKDAAKPKTLDIQNTALFDLFPGQQNIIQTTVSGKKQSLLLTSDNKNGVLNCE
ncbi:MAG TPA: DUF6702 family protein [Flavobacterium sp.]|nr:DUF6702 family protein [Flavobacterium sp.]